MVETIRKIPPELQSDIHLFKLENYAREYFTKQRKGLFRRAVKIDSLLQHSKEIHGSLLNNLDAKNEKKAIEIFQNLLIYMGDKPKKSKDSTVNYAQKISHFGVQCPELRDEIYCQIIKQVTLNPEM